MITKVITAIRKYGLLDDNKNVTVALSGGADSVCLLMALKKLSAEYGITLSAIHVNHMLRGDESFRDEAFVKELCEKNGIPLVVKREDVNALATESGVSVELAARELRYKIFKENAEGLVATAHSADDNLETVLYNLTRGTGIKGLCGIPPKRDIFIRPLILCTREEIEGFLAENGAEFVTDSTNLTDQYTRNFIRHKGVTVLKKVNPSVAKNISVMADNLREDEEFLSSTARKIYTLCLRGDFLDSELLRIQPPAILKRVVMLFLNEQYGTSADAFHLEECQRVILLGGKTGLCSNKLAVCEGGRFYVTDKNGKKDPQIEFSVETEKIIPKESEKINNLFLKNAIDCDKIIGSLKLRSRLPSDEIKLRGRNCTKSLKKLLNELKIPLELRDVIPVAADDLGVIWIYGIDVAQRVAVDENSNQAIRFTVNTINKS
ncbi:MAG: tRNA lysidine(34) synthetase TilS [Acutalibacteraceae bacterium]|nr:tRNA lysidine(34) synthetase TilS [Acutalibacteraceae bacterium]